MFDLLLLNLRAQGLQVGMQEWITFLGGIERGLVTDLEELYGFGRAVLCTSEAWYDAFDLAFQATFEGVELPPKIKAELLEWLKDAQLQLQTPSSVDLDLDEGLPFLGVLLKREQDMLMMAERQAGGRFRG